MLRLMRDYAGSWLIKIILGAIVIVFVFWGVGNFQSQRLDQIATVNGEIITIEEHRNAYNNLIEQYRQRFRQNMTEDMLKMLNLKQTALDQLINEVLLRQEAAKLNFRVSDDELAKHIMDIPAFQQNGSFDNALYTRLLRQSRLSPEEFEASQREALLTQKVRDFVSDTVKISKAEAQEWYRWNNASADMEYALFEPAQYTDIQISDEELQKYYDTKKESYKTEEKIKARYLEFRYADYNSKVTVLDEDIEDYFQNHPKEFKVEKTVEARHILFKLDKDAADDEVEKKRKSAEEVMKMAKEGKDFAELAKEYSEGPTKDKGGLLGAFKKEAMVKPFSDKAFSMAAGDISEPVRTQFGWHIIKVEKVNEASEKKLEEVAADIRKKLADEKAKGKAFDEAQELHDSAYEGDDLKILAENRKLELMETDFFTRNKGPERLKKYPQFTSAAFGLADKQMSKVEELADACYIIQVSERIPSEVSPFEEVKEKVRADLLKEKQDEKAKQDAEAFLANLKKGNEGQGGSPETAEAPATENADASQAESGNNTAENTDPAPAPEDHPEKTDGGENESLSSEKENVSLISTGFFKRSASIPEIGYEQEISKAAFALSKENPLPESPLKGRKGYYVIRFKDKKFPDDQEFEKEEKSVKERLLRQKQYKVFESWIGQIKDNSEIFIEKDLLN